MSTDLSSEPRRQPFDALPHASWPEIASALSGVWPRAAAEHDLRWYAAEHALRSVKLPSVRDLAARWSWSRSRVHDLLTAETSWRDPARPWSWRHAEPQIRTPSGQSPDTIRTVAGQTEPTNADNADISGQSPDTIRTVAGHHPDSRAFLIGSPDIHHPTPDTTPGATAPLPPKWAAVMGTEITPTDAPPVVAVEPAKVKRIRATKATTTDTHADKVIAAWCDAHLAATGDKYDLRGADIGKLKRIAIDYLTGEAWPEKLATLATGMATYIAAPDRWPKGPPTVGGFCIDPQRWIAQKPANTTPAPMALHNPY